MANYSRKCRTCGRWINIRQMPQGQWVAFEGDEQHRCKKPPVTKPKPKPQTKPTTPGEEFPGIDVPGATGQRPVRKPTPEPKGKLPESEFPPIDIPDESKEPNTPLEPKHVKPLPRTLATSPQSSVQMKNGGNWRWLGWAALALFILFGILSGR